MMRDYMRIRSLAGGSLLVILLVICDQFTKHLATVHLKDQPNQIWIRGVMELSYVENRGAAFGILQNQRWLFILLFLVILFIVAVFYCRAPLSGRFFPLRMIALFVTAGGFGNLIDRVRTGYVVDFFYFSLIDFPVFNVADIYVTVSMFVLFFLLIFYYREEDLEQIFAALSFKKE